METALLEVLPLIWPPLPAVQVQPLDAGEQLLAAAEYDPPWLTSSAVGPETETLAGAKGLTVRAAAWMKLTSSPSRLTRIRGRKLLAVEL